MTKIVSADNFFMKDGKYEFDPTKLGAAHAECLRDYIETVRRSSIEMSKCHVAVLRGISGSGKSSWEGKRHYDIVVDNTNCSIAELAPYMSIAQAYGANATIIEFHCPVEVAAERNTHGVPLVNVQKQYNTMMANKTPPWWPVITVGRT